jgi:glycosyltransferase involved in cell wall biosynthesis
MTDPVEVSVVMPCLDEADTLGSCIGKAQEALRASAMRGEVIVADNASTDGSAEIAARLGARVVRVEKRGYGHALMGGIAAARGRYVVIGDADDSYDFGEIPKFVEKLREGYELVQGCRLPAGGGRILPGAMPALHRHFGNPLLSSLARRWFWSSIHDVYCGMRGFTRALFERLDQRCTGMEFATEMIIKASIAGARITEVPITLHPDGRRTHTPHLRTFRDGWRTLRFFLLYSPSRLFLLPGLLLILGGLAGYAVALPGVTAVGVNFDAHTLLVASLAVICGYQAIQFGVFTKVFAASEGLLPPDRRIIPFVDRGRLEVGLLVGIVGMLAGLVLLGAAVDQWRRVHFGHLEYAHTMRWVIPGVTLTVLGFQTCLSSFFLGVLALKRR